MKWAKNRQEAKPWENTQKQTHVFILSLPSFISPSIPTSGRKHKVFISKGRFTPSRKIFFVILWWTKWEESFLSVSANKFHTAKINNILLLSVFYHKFAIKLLTFLTDLLKNAANYSSRDFLNNCPWHSFSSYSLSFEMDSGIFITKIRMMWLGELRI